MFIDVAHVKGCGNVSRKKKTAIEVALRTTNHSLSPCTASEKERESASWFLLLFPPPETGSVMFSTM